MKNSNPLQGMIVPKRKRGRPSKAESEQFDALKPGTMLPTSEYRTVLRLQWDLARDLKMACKEHNVSVNHALETLVSSWVRHLHTGQDTDPAVEAESKKRKLPKVKRKKA